MNSYLVTFGYSQYLVQHSMNNPEGRKTTIRRYLMIASICVAWYKVDKEIETTICAMCSLKSSATLENYTKTAC